MTFYPEKLQLAIRARGLTISQAAKAGGISEGRLQQALKNSRPPTVKQIEALIEALAVPSYAFFYAKFEMPKEEIVDFRTSNPQPLKSGVNTKRIYLYKRMRTFFSHLGEALDSKVDDGFIAISKDDNAEQIAAAVHKHLRLSTIREQSSDKKEFLRNFRKRLSDLGLVVIQDHNISMDIDGLALQSETDTAHTIVINSRARNAGARSFTLAHELCHILSGRSALSDSYQADNATERFCNEFASALLLPRSEFFAYCERRKLGFADYRSAITSADYLSEHFFTSISACLIRAYTLNLSKENYYTRFARNAFSADHPDTEKPKQGGGPEDGPAPGVIDKAYLGERAVALITTALERKITTELEVFENTGLSRKRIQGLATIAKKEGISLK